MRITTLLGIGLVLSLIPLVSASAAMSDGDGDGEGPGNCDWPNEYAFAVVDVIGINGGIPGTRTTTCYTWFMGMNVHESSISCADWVETIPLHYHCSGVKNRYQHCLGGARPVIISSQTMKADCEGATGLNVEVGGVEFGIDWWKAVCNKVGPPVPGIHLADAAVACPPSGTWGDGE